MWATSVEQLQDQAEICYGVDIVREEVRHQRGLAQFFQQVLNAIPEQVMSRRAMTFVTCFRPTMDENERAPYCLSFNTLADRAPRLRPGPWANVEYRPVIYRPDRQRRAIQQAVGAVVSALQSATQGQNYGPWGPSLVNFHGQISSRSQALMNLISSFKCWKYKWEDEWRIVCGPISSVNLAPNIDDENFRSLIRRGGNDSKTHLELRILREQPDPLVAFPESEIPFSRVYYSQGVDHQQIRDLLSESGRPDIEVLEYPKLRKWWARAKRN